MWVSDLEQLWRLFLFWRYVLGSDWRYWSVFWSFSRVERSLLASGWIDVDEDWCCWMFACSQEKTKAQKKSDHFTSGTECFFCQSNQNGGKWMGLLSSVWVWVSFSHFTFLLNDASHRWHLFDLSLTWTLCSLNCHCQFPPLFGSAVSHHWHLKMSPDLSLMKLLIQTQDTTQPTNPKKRYSRLLEKKAWTSSIEAD